MVFVVYELIGIRGCCEAVSWALQNSEIGHHWEEE